MRNLERSLRLYLVADPQHSRHDFHTNVQAALCGGVTAVQLRAKSITDREILLHASALRELCSQFGATFIVNDRVDIALASRADGVHLGVDDMPIESARAMGGPDFIIGYSPETDEQIRTASARGADYLGIGPVFGTASKLDAGAALGIGEFVRRSQLTGLPSVGIGGVTPGNAKSVIEGGGAGVAVISAILGASDPEAAARQLSRNS